jgi:DNA-binding transcriptional regulator LsrR (DeoR family)
VDIALNPIPLDWSEAILPILRKDRGMTVVETIARIRFEHFQNGKGIKRIARELGIARDTVRKVLRSGVTEFVLEATVFPTLELFLTKSQLARKLDSSTNLELFNLSSWTNQQKGHTSLCCELARATQAVCASILLGIYCL